MKRHVRNTLIGTAATFALLTAASALVEIQAPAKARSCGGCLALAAVVTGTGGRAGVT
ncbi:MAG: hypothetical protein JWQ39_1530 [Glaciihabitans sp.]|nr:hypothetical protein [Glaciihabitans sp.]